jgi:hypothetical protein
MATGIEIYIIISICIYVFLCIGVVGGSACLFMCIGSCVAYGTCCCLDRCGYWRGNDDEYVEVVVDKAKEETNLVRREKREKNRERREELHKTMRGEV